MSTHPGRNCPDGPRVRRCTRTGGSIACCVPPSWLPGESALGLLSPDRLEDRPVKPVLQVDPT